MSSILGRHLILTGGSHVNRPRTIVVGIDGSESADRAAIWAAHSAVVRNAVLRIVTAVAPQLSPTSRDPGETAQAVAGSRLDAARILARESVEGAPLDIVVEAREGNTVDVLLDESSRSDLVVLGARGLGESDSGVLGSVAVALSAHCACPVVVVRGRSMDGLPPAQGPVVVGVDGSAINQVAIAAAFDEAAQRGSALIAVHVWSDVSLAHGAGVPQDWEVISASEQAVLAESLAGWQEKYPDVEVRRVVAQDRPVRVLSQLSEQAALIVVGSRGRGGFTGMLLGSTSYALIQTADCPVMVVRGS
ncbi:universal stress protein [Rhodococcus sp. 1163]|nr:universal stress protein [Rhodococcus sp. 1163]